MGKLLFYHFRVTNSRVKSKNFHFELKTGSWKLKVSLWVTNSIGKLSFFHHRITNSKLKNENFYFELLIPKMKKTKYWFWSPRDFFIEMKYYAI